MGCLVYHVMVWDHLVLYPKPLLVEQIWIISFWAFKGIILKIAFFLLLIHFHPYPIPIFLFYWFSDYRSYGNLQTKIKLRIYVTFLLQLIDLRILLKQYIYQINYAP